LRAFRVLWSRVLEAWGLDAQNPAFTHLQAIPAISTETVADPHVNLLRHTTQAMAAIMGGCTLLSLPAYDAQFGGANVDAARTARNIQLVLREEAYLGKTMDAGGGAYFVESLTDELASKAWAIFQTIEAAGGWSHYSQQKLGPLLMEGKRKRLAAVRSGAKTLLGTNHFANEQETIATPHAIPAAGLGISPPDESTDRLAAPFERVRLQLQAASSRQGGIQNALLFTLGDPVMRAARANFARNVLAAGGYICTENQHPTDLKAAVAVAKTLQPSVIVLCGADADYFEKGREWLDAIRNALPAATLILAGKPDGWEQLQASGIAEPIFAGMDRVAFLERLLEHVQQRKEVRP
jgi:methylmalonyl-CoA mutase